DVVIIVVHIMIITLYACHLYHFFLLISCCQMCGEYICLSFLSCFPSIIAPLRIHILTLFLRLFFFLFSVLFFSLLFYIFFVVFCLFIFIFFIFVLFFFFFFFYFY